MTIAISAGTTTTELARRLRHRSSITVVTNSISVFEVLTDPGADAADAPQVYLSPVASAPRLMRSSDRSPTPRSRRSGWTPRISAYTGSIRRPA